MNLIRNAGCKPEVMLRIGRAVRQARAHIVHFERTQGKIFRDPDVKTAAHLHRKRRCAGFQAGRRRVYAVECVDAAKESLTEEARAMLRSKDPIGPPR